MDHSTSGVIESRNGCQFVQTWFRRSTPGIPTRSTPPYISSSQGIFEEARPEHTKGAIEVHQLLSNCLSTPKHPAGWNHPVIYAIIDPSPHLDPFHYANPLSPLSKRC